MTNSNAAVDAGRGDSALRFMTGSIDLERRQLLQSAMVLLGAVSTSAWAKPARKPAPYLDPSLFAALSALSDTLIPRTDTPGAVDVRVPGLLEALMVNWASSQRRHELTQALVKLDAVAFAKEGKAFTQLPPAARETILKAHEAEAMKVLPRTGPAGVAEMLSGPAYADPGYGKLKELIVLLYYVSEPALTQELTYVHAPGEWKPSIPVTPDSRPAAGGLF